MQVAIFNTSPRRDGNTQDMLQIVANRLEENGIRTQTIQVGGKLIHGCTGCGGCGRNIGRCVFEDDVINECCALMQQSQGILIGSPTYFGDVTTECKALMDRTGSVLRKINGLDRKVGAAVTVMRRAAGICAFDSINRYFLINGMTVIGSSYWNVCLGREKGQAKEDQEGIKTMEKLAENMAYAMKRLF